MEQRSLFGLSEHLDRLSKTGDPLEVLDRAVDFESFRGWLVEASAMATAARAGVLPLTRSRCSRR